jgi:hypothetical protein
MKEGKRPIRIRTTTGLINIECMSMPNEMSMPLPVILSNGGGYAVENNAADECFHLIQLSIVVLLPGVVYQQSVELAALVVLHNRLHFTLAQVLMDGPNTYGRGIYITLT